MLITIMALVAFEALAQPSPRWLTDFNEAQIQALRSNKNILAVLL